MINGINYIVTKEENKSLIHCTVSDDRKGRVLRICAEVDNEEKIQDVILEVVVGGFCLPISRETVAITRNELSGILEVLKEYEDNHRGEIFWCWKLEQRLFLRNGGIIHNGKNVVELPCACDSRFKIQEDPRNYIPKSTLKVCFGCSDGLIPQYDGVVLPKEGEHNG